MNLPWNCNFIWVLHEIALEINQREVIKGIGGVELHLWIILLQALLATRRAWLGFVLVSLTGAVSLVVRDLCFIGGFLFLSTNNPADQVFDGQFAIKLRVISDKLLKS